MRSLALRSKEAANKTEELIRDSVKQAVEGEVTAQHVNEQLAEIAALGLEGRPRSWPRSPRRRRSRRSGIDQVTKAVAQMDKVTQQNAASSEESSSAAAELSGQSEELAAMVGAFRVEARASGAGDVASPARTRRNGACPTP